MAVESPTSEFNTAEPESGGPAPATLQIERRTRWWIWLLVAAGVVAAAAAFVFLTRMWPSYDAYGWLVWGHQTLHGHLNTDGAPSWKPLTFLFTVPYALLGPTQLKLWMVTAVSGAVASALLAGRIAYRLSGPSPGRRFAPIVGAVFAALGVLGMVGWWHQVLIANSDPMIVALCLGAIDLHLSRRYKLAFTMIVLAGLGRPEAWPFVYLYALWSWRAVPSMRPLAVAGALLIPASWFVVPGLTSKSWLKPGDLALNSVNVIHGNKITGVVGRFLGIYELPMLLTWLAAIVIAVWRRDRTTLGIAAAAVLWVIVEVGFALHGWSAVARYMIEPAAVMVALGGSAVGRALAVGPSAPLLVRIAAPIAVVAVVVALLPFARDRVRGLRHEIADGRHAHTQIARLDKVIHRLGGAARIRACGQPVTTVGFQSTLAWYVGLNVGNVGYKPGRSINKGLPIVLFKPYRHGWQVRPIHTLPANAAACAALRTDTDLG
jgi:hypothetical protein